MPIVISTDRENVVLRQLANERDDLAYFESYNASRPEIEAFDRPEDRGKYEELDQVRNARLSPDNADRLRLGIWDNDTFVGSINLTPDEDGAEIGYWLDSRQTGHGYATTATQAVAKFGLEQYNKVHANVVKGNDASARVLERSGFKRTSEQAGKLFFELTEVKPAQIIETATPADLEAVAEHMEAVYADTYPNDRGIRRDMFENNAGFQREMRAYLEGQLADPSKKLFVAKQADHIIGTIGIDTSPEQPREGKIWGFYVDAALHEQGIGRELWAKVMTEVDEAGLETLILEVAKDSTAATEFYLRRGFEITGEEDWDWPSWTDEHPHNQYWLMTKLVQ